MKPKCYYNEIIDKKSFYNEINIDFLYEIHIGSFNLKFKDCKGNIYFSDNQNLEPKKFKDIVFGKFISKYEYAIEYPSLLSKFIIEINGKIIDFSLSNYMYLPKTDIEFIKWFFKNIKVDNIIRIFYEEFENLFKYKEVLRHMEPFPIYLNAYRKIQIWKYCHLRKFLPKDIVNLIIK
jgi:hypothetical protein